MQLGPKWQMGDLPAVSLATLSQVAGGYDVLASLPRAGWSGVLLSVMGRTCGLVTNHLVGLFLGGVYRQWILTGSPVEVHRGSKEGWLAAAKQRWALAIFFQVR